MDYNTFYKTFIGTGWDVDGYYGNQCWDGYAKWCIENDVPFCYCTNSGYVKDIWEQRYSNGILNYFDEVETLQPGDVVLFTENAYTPYSHIALFHSDIDGSQGYFMGQNQGGYNGNFDLCALPYWGTYTTAFRLKTATPAANPIDELIQEDGIATLTVSDVRARKGAPSGEIVRVYNEGDKIHYNWKYIGNGHRYIVWQENGEYIFLAISGTEDRSEMWATFSDPNETTDNPSTGEFNEDTKEESVKKVFGYGVDISSYNGDIDLTPYDFVIIRINEGVKIDSMFEANVCKCEELNIPYGVYWYDYALNLDGAAEQAEMVLKAIEGKNISCGVWFDMEDADGFKAANGILTKEHITPLVNKFLEIISKAGYYCGVYSTEIWFNTYMPEVECNKWIAFWGINDGEVHGDFSDKAVMHQYTSVPLDKDLIYVPISELSNKKEEKPSEGVTPAKPQTPTEEEELGTGFIALLKKFLKWIKKIFKEED